MNKLPFAFLVIFICLADTISGQQLSRYNFPVELNGQDLENAWVGGLKSPQFSTGDLNNDGQDDLFVFDKTGNVILTFKNEGTGDDPQFAYRPSLAVNFPELEDWAMLRDFNGDGAPDIFGQLTNTANQGIGVWKGKWEGNVLAFDRISFPQLSIDAIPISTGNGLFTQIFVSTQDIPGIFDLDDDGDLDILTFSSLGGVIFHYQNMDVENGNSLETFEYEKVDDCWGRLYESGIDGCLDLSPNANDCAALRFTEMDTERNGGLHAGSTLAIFDGDDDGDKEVVLGDISFTNLIYASNNQSSGTAWIDNQDCEYPSYDLPLDLIAFPAAYVADMNNDGKRDMVVSANSPISGQDRNSVWYYKNTGTDLAPIFDFQENEFLVDEMVDVGQGANPTLVDFNADGLLDIVVGNNSYWLPGGIKESRIQLLLNVGTIDQPSFELADDDVAGLKDIFLSSANIFNFAPTFGDLDGDGDEDLFFGDNSGRITFVENTAGINQPMTFGFPEYNWMEMKVGQQSTPEIVDINRDGLLDFIVGEKTVNFIDYTDTVSSFNLFINTGTATEPMFTPNPNEFPNFQYFGFVETVDDGFSSGESAPAILDTGSEFLLFSGASSGKIKVYENIEGNIYGKFDELYSDYGNLKVGWATRPALGDINDDGILDMLVGNRRGGLTFVETDFRMDGTSTATASVQKEIEFQIFPNPTDDQINVSFSKDAKRCQVQIFDQTGRLIHFEKNVETEMVISLGHLPAGMYFLKLVDQAGRQAIEKIVVQ